MSRHYFNENLSWLWDGEWPKCPNSKCLPDPHLSFIDANSAMSFTVQAEAMCT